MFVTQAENILKANLTGKLYKGISPEGEEFIFDNINKFAREHGLNQPNIWGCLSGKRKTHKGWQFENIV